MPRIHSQQSAEYYSQPMRGLSVLGMLAEYGQALVAVPESDSLASIDDSY